jgi:hypothetical protein
VGLEWGPLSLVSTTEELLGRKSSGYGLEIREYCRRDPPRWPRDTLYPQKLTLTSSISLCHSDGVVRSRNQATELLLLLLLLLLLFRVHIYEYFVMLLLVCMNEDNLFFSELSLIYESKFSG